MLSLLTLGIAEYSGRINMPAFRKARNGLAESRILCIGRTEVLHTDLTLPLSIGQAAFEKQAQRAVDAMVEMGADEGVLPKYMEGYARKRGLRRADDLRLLRERGAQAALDGLRGQSSAYVKVYAKMACREATDCALELAESCRYVTAAGGEWAASMRKRLLRDYGTAAPPNGVGGWRAAVVFDGGFEYSGEDLVIDLSRDAFDCPNRVRPRVEELKAHGLPTCGFYDKSRLLAAIFIKGGIDSGEIRAYCPTILDR